MPISDLAAAMTSINAQQLHDYLHRHVNGRTVRQTLIN
jgi:hypothetical protein